MSSNSLTYNAVQEALSPVPRPYQFKVHGQSNRFQSWRAEQSRSPRKKKNHGNTGKKPVAYVWPGPREEFCMKQLADPSSLKMVYDELRKYGGAAPGADRITYEDLDNRAIGELLQRLSDAIQDGSYRPSPARPVSIPKGDGRFRELQISSVHDRVAAKALRWSLQDFWARRLAPVLSVWDVFAGIQRTMRERQVYYLAVDDVKNCYPSAQIRDVLDCHERYITQSDLLRLIETIVRGQDGHEHTIGLAQGSPYSPIAMELLLQNRLDAPLGARCQELPQLYRYVDNLNIVCSSECESRNALSKCNEILQSLGMELKNQDGPPRDICDQHNDQVVLGLIPRWEANHLTFDIPDAGFQHLREGFNEALNSRPSLQRAKDVTTGWINAIGPALAEKKRKPIINRVVEIAWKCGFNELQQKALNKTAKQAHERWLQLANGNTPRTTTGRIPDMSPLELDQDSSWSVSSAPF